MMRMKRHSSEEIMQKLREAEVYLSNGMAFPEVCRKLEISEQTLYRWRNQYGGTKDNNGRRARELETQNAQLKKLVAEQALEIHILKEAAQGKY